MQLLPVAIIIFAQSVPAASFDCSKASRPNEKLICSDPELSSLDDQLSNVYWRYVSVNPEIKANQIEWIKSTRSCSSEPSPINCLKQSYRDRITLLNSASNSNRGIVGSELGSVANAPATSLDTSSQIVAEVSKSSQGVKMEQLPIGGALQSVAPHSNSQPKNKPDESSGILWGLPILFVVLGAGYWFWRKKKSSDTRVVIEGDEYEDAVCIAQEKLSKRDRISNSFGPDSSDSVREVHNVTTNKNIVAASENSAQEDVIAMKADKFTYIVLAQVQSEDGWGANLQGVSSKPLFIFENSNSGEVFGFIGSEISSYNLLQSADDKWGGVIDPYIEKNGLLEFNTVTGEDVSDSYLKELIAAALDKAGEGSDFEYENGVGLTLLDGEEEVMNEEALEQHVGKCGIWIMTRDDLNISIEKTIKLIIDGEVVVDLDEAVSSYLMGNGDMNVVLLENR